MKRLILIILILFLALNGFGAAYDVRSVTIATNGWQAWVVLDSLSTGGTYEYGFGTNYNPVGGATPKLVLITASTGYTDAGSTTTVYRTNFGTKWVRQPYPYSTGDAEVNQTNDWSLVDATNVQIKIALSDFIYSSDAVTAVVGSGLYTQGGHANNATNSITCTNLSTVPHSRPIANWSIVPHQRITNDTFKLKAVAFHRHGQQARPVRLVKFWAYDEHSNTNTVLVTSPTIDFSDTNDATKVIEYIGVMSASSLTQGDVITCNFAAYPWIGNSPLDTSDGANSQPTPLYAPIKLLNDKTGAYGLSYALVMSGGGAGEVRTNYADFLSNPPAPFGSIDAALTNMLKTNAAAFGRLDCAGYVYLSNGNWSFTGANGTYSNSTKTWVEITAHTGVSRSSVDINASSGRADIGDMVHLRNITLSSSANGTYSGMTNLWIDNCVVNSTGWTWVDDVDLLYVTHCLIENWGHGAIGTDVGIRANVGRHMAPALIRGNTFHGECVEVVSVYNVIGNLHPADEACDLFEFLIEPFESAPPTDGAICAFNRIFRKHNLTQKGWLSGGEKANVGHGVAIVQNLLEVSSTTEPQPFGMWFAGDYNHYHTTNAIIWNNTVAGGRINYAYNDGEYAGSSNSPFHIILHSSRGNMYYKAATKTDVFGPTTNATTRWGNWPARYCVGSWKDVSGNINNQPGANSYAREFSGTMCYYPQSTTHASNANWFQFVDEKCFASGTNVGGGDYHLLSSSPVIALTNDLLLPYDIDGYPRSLLNPPGAYVGEAQTSNVYHVRIEGTNSNDGLTYATAFRTIQKALDVATNGWSIYVYPGNYDEYLVTKAHGVTNAPIHLRAIPPNDSSQMVRIKQIRVQHKFHVIEGFHFTGAAEDANLGAIRLENEADGSPDASYCVITNNTIRDGAYVWCTNLTFLNLSNAIQLPSTMAWAWRDSNIWFSYDYTNKLKTDKVPVFLGSSSTYTYRNHDKLWYLNATSSDGRTLYLTNNTYLELFSFGTNSSGPTTYYTLLPRAASTTSTRRTNVVANVAEGQIVAQYMTITNYPSYGLLRAGSYQWRWTAHFTNAGDAIQVIPQTWVFKSDGTSNHLSSGAATALSTTLADYTVNGTGSAYASISTNDRFVLKLVATNVTGTPDVFMYTEGYGASGADAGGYIPLSMLGEEGTNNYAIVYVANGNDGYDGIKMVPSYNFVTNTTLRGVVITGNTFSNLWGSVVVERGYDNWVSNNTFINNHGWYATRPHGARTIWSHNLFLNNLNFLIFTDSELADPDLHPPGSDLFDYNVGFLHTQEAHGSNSVWVHNWLENNDSQMSYFGQSNTTEYTTFTSNVWIGFLAHGNLSRDLARMSNNTFFRCAYDRNTGPIAFGGLSKVQTNPICVYNAFIDCGDHTAPPDLDDFGWYNWQQLEQNPPNNYGVTNAIFNYNFVCGSESLNWHSKANFGKPLGYGYEANSVNGGDPCLVDPNNPRGPDGLPFTEDDGLRPLPSSPLAKNGIGALPARTNALYEPIAHFTTFTVSNWFDPSNYFFYPTTAWLNLKPWQRTTNARHYSIYEAIGRVPARVGFTASNSIGGMSLSSTNTNGISRYFWQFSDGRSQTTMKPECYHTFLYTGEVSVVLWITNYQGNVDSSTNWYRILWATNNFDIFYVATNGNDSATGNGTNQNDPLLTLGKAITNVTAGDYIAVGPGDFTTNKVIEFKRNVATENNRISVFGHGSRIFNAEMQYPYWTLDGFQIRYNSALGGSMGYAYLYATADGIWLLNNVFPGPPGGGDANAVRMYAGGELPNDSQLNCIISNNFTYSIDFPQYQIYGSNNWIINNVCDTTGNEGDFVRLWGASNYIIGNWMTNLTSDGGGGHADFVQSFGSTNAAQAITHLRNIVILNNYVWGRRAQPCMFETVSGPTNGPGRGYTNLQSGIYSNILFMNNVFFGLGGAANVDMQGTKWFNNLFYQVSWEAPPSGMLSTGGEKGPADGTMFMNNLMVFCGNTNTYANTNGGFYNAITESNTTLVADYNFVTRTNLWMVESNAVPTTNEWGYSGRESHGINGGNPGFAASNLYVFRLTTNSQVLNKGTNLSSIANGISTDIEGVSRPQGSAWDIGPYEGTTDAPEPPAYTPANMELSTTSISVSCLTNSKPSQSTYTIRNSGNTAETIYYTNWLNTNTFFTCSATNGDVTTETDTITLTYNNSVSNALVASYTGYITNIGWTNTGASRDVVDTILLTVSLSVTASPSANLSINPASWTLSRPVGTDRYTNTYIIYNSVTNGQGVVFSNHVTTSASWLSSSLAGGSFVTNGVTNSAIIDVTGLSANTYTGYITNRSWTNSVFLEAELYTVTLEVTNVTPGTSANFEIAPATYSATVLSNTIPTAAAYGIWNSGDTSFSIDYTNTFSATWFVASTTNGSVTSETDSNTVTFSGVTNLSVGVYTGYITNSAWTNGIFLEATNFVMTITVTASPPANLSITPASWTTACLTNAAIFSNSYALWNSGTTNETIFVTNTSSAAWLNFQLTNITITGNTATNFAIVNPSGLSIGAYTGYITNSAWTNEGANRALMEQELFQVSLSVTGSIPSAIMGSQFRGKLSIGGKTQFR